MTDELAGLPTIEQVNDGMVKSMQMHEEIILRLLDELAKLDDIDRRWLSIGRTSIEEGFMAVNRSIMAPPRFSLPGEEG